jgi:hypothetical protein
MLINGQGYDFASIKLTMLGTPVVAGFKGISYTTNQEKVNSNGVGGEPVERTRGNVSYEGSVSLTLKEVKAIRAAAGNLPLTKIPAFSIAVSYANGVDPVTVDTLLFCEFTSDPTSSSQGDTEITIELPLIIGGIRYNA